MTTPVWFGPEDRPLSGFFHTPADRRARAGVVICPPLGRDYLHAHYALRLLAERLGDLGLCVLRFDYDGTGDSAGSDRDPARVAAWLSSLSAAIDLVRASGPSPVVLVGMRAGALLAGVAAQRQQPNLDGLVLWDPVSSGRAYLSEQRALHSLAFGNADPSAEGMEGTVETPGMVFSEATATELRSLDLSRTEGPLARRVLVLTRTDRESRSLAARFDRPHVTWSPAHGQAELMDVGSPFQVLPGQAIEEVAQWIVGGAPVRSAPVTVPPQAGTVVVAQGPHGAPVKETPSYVGPSGLFGFLTESPACLRGPTVLFINVANEHRIGPARMWVDLARRWAGLGIRSFRVDLSGLGDSPTRSPGQPRFVTRAPVAFDDVADTVRALRPDDPSDVVLVGLCASGYQALDSALAVRPRGVVAINPVISFQPPELIAGEPLDPRRRVAIPRKSAVQAFHGTGRAAALRRRAPRLNDRVRDLSEVVDGLLADKERRPSSWLGDLTNAGTDVLIVCGEREARPLQATTSARTFRRLEATGRFRLELIPGLEHGLLLAAQRIDVEAIATRHVCQLSGIRNGPVPLLPTRSVPLLPTR